MEKTEFYIGWQITPKCNLECIHCYTSYGDLPELPLGDKLKIVGKIAALSTSWELDTIVDGQGQRLEVVEEKVDKMGEIKKMVDSLGGVKKVEPALRELLNAA